MNTGKINNILALFDKYRVCIPNEDAIATIVSKSDVVGESDNEVLYIEYGDEYCVKFNESGLNGAFVKNGMLVMEDMRVMILRLSFRRLRCIIW